MNRRISDGSQQLSGLSDAQRFAAPSAPQYWRALIKNTDMGLGQEVRCEEAAEMAEWPLAVGNVDLAAVIIRVTGQTASTGAGPAKPVERLQQCVRGAVSEGLIAWVACTGGKADVVSPRSMEDSSMSPYLYQSQPGPVESASMPRIIPMTWCMHGEARCPQRACRWDEKYLER